MSQFTASNFFQEFLLQIEVLCSIFYLIHGLNAPSLLSFLKFYLLLISQGIA